MGNNIDILRKRAGMTVKRLADESGLSLGYINELKKGDKRLNVDTLNKISKALKCSPEDIISTNKELTYATPDSPRGLMGEHMQSQLPHMRRGDVGELKFELFSNKEWDERTINAAIKYLKLQLDVDEALGTIHRSVK